MTPNQFFVYGTLKRDQCRGHRWPRRPVSVTPAWLFGRLWHRADYPAMTAGEDRVVGEVWQFIEADMPAVLKVIDEIEGTGQPGYPDLYTREIAEVFRIEPRQQTLLGNAFTYLYATDPANDGFEVMEPTANTQVEWPPLR